MRVLYVARHDKGCNDNEGAIAHALRQLGHDVECLHEANWSPKEYHRLAPDLLLFQNWKQPEIPDAGGAKIFWYFDRVQYHHDPILRSWTLKRMGWMDLVMSKVDVGFCTDGDWVNSFPGSNLEHLMQGADERVAGTQPHNMKSQRLLFTGSVYGRGRGRRAFVQELSSIHQSSFQHRNNLYGSALIEAVQNSAIVLAPDGPVSDSYWSNRVYVMLSFGAFMLHPYCRLLADQYEDGKEIVYFHNRRDLHEKVEHYLQHPEDRAKIARAGYERTMEEHTYRHRCQSLLRTAEARGAFARRRTNERAASIGADDQSRTETSKKTAKRSYANMGD